MIIGIAGRKSSGKSTIANVLINKGFKKASFGDPLKRYTSQLYDWEIDSLYTQEGKESLLNCPVEWNEDACKKLSDIIGIEIPYSGKKVFNTKRDALQYIGTDVLRDQVDKDFHINKFKQFFTEGDYVCDDLRFPNESKTIKEMGGVPIFLIRPNYWDYSNHSSEISLCRHDFNYVYINDKSKVEILEKFNSFMENLFDQKYEIFSKDKFIDIFSSCDFDTEITANKLQLSLDEISNYVEKYMPSIYRDSYSLDNHAFSRITPESAFWAGALSVAGRVVEYSKYDYFLEFSSKNKPFVENFKRFIQTKNEIYNVTSSHGKKYYLQVGSPYLTEDLKLWDIEPTSSVSREPEVLQDSPLLDYWVVGKKTGESNG